MTTTDTPVLRPGPCTHPSVSDETARRYADDAFAAWQEEPRCPDCREYLYPHFNEDDGTVVVYTDEPYGAGR